MGKAITPQTEGREMLYHGAHTRFEAHEGQCWTENVDAAARYAGRTGQIAQLDVDLSGLVVVECEGYDHDEDEAPADNLKYRQQYAAEGVDILVYEDEDDMGREITCYRLVSERSVRIATASARLVE